MSDNPSVRTAIAVLRALPEDVRKRWDADISIVEALAAAGLLADPATNAENEELKRWKAEAMTVLGEWENVWEAAGKPGRLGGSKAAGVFDVVLRSKNA